MRPLAPQHFLSSSRVTKACGWSRLAIAFVLLGGLSPATRAATIAYWRFEDSPGFLNDSSGNGNTLQVVGTVTQATLPSGIRGAFFPNPIPLTGAPNAKAADFPGTSDMLQTVASLSSSPTTAFTIETLAHWETSPNNNEPGSFADFLVSANSIGFQIRTDGFNGTNPNGELFLSVVDGSGGHFFNSGFSPTMDHDYYFAVSFDAAASTANFYVKDLTTGGPLQTFTATDGVIGALVAAGQVGIGSHTASLDGFDFDGLIDEVRLSDTVLPPSQLLISQPAVPEPGTWALFGLGLVVLRWGSQRRRRREEAERWEQASGE